MWSLNSCIKSSIICEVKDHIIVTHSRQTESELKTLSNATIARFDGDNKKVNH